jgi:hypothetical protein
VTLTRWSKEHVSRGSDKNATNIRVEGKHVESKPSDWEVPETAMCIKVRGLLLLLIFSGISLFLCTIFY